MGWPFSELNIEPTTERRAIKRAYAKLLKSARPDEDPDAFQALYAAYEAALELARNPEAFDGMVEELSLDAQEAELGGATDPLPSQRPSEPQPPSAYTRIMEEMQALLQSETPFADMERWDALIAHDSLDDMDTMRQVSFGAFAQLCDFGWNNRPRLRKRGKFTEILNKFDQRFAWSEQELALSEAFGEQPAENLLKRLEHEPARPPMSSERLAEAAGENQPVDSEGAFYFWIIVFFIGLSIIGRLLN